MLVVVITGTGVSAQPADASDNLPVSDSNNPSSTDTLAVTDGSDDGTIDVSIQNWRGFAEKDDESHPLRLNVETIRPVDPAEARRLLASNISLEEMRSRVRAEDRDVIRRGSMRIENDIYQLINITVTFSGNSSLLNAGVAGPVAGPRSRSAMGDGAAVVGHIDVATSLVEDAEVGEGTLVIDDPEYSGTYRLLLDQFPGRGPRAGMTGRVE